MLSLKGIQSQSLEEVKQKLLSMPKKEYDFTVNLNCFGKGVDNKFLTYRLLKQGLTHEQFENQEAIIRWLHTIDEQRANNPMEKTTAYNSNQLFAPKSRSQAVKLNEDCQIQRQL